MMLSLVFQINIVTEHSAQLNMKCWFLKMSRSFANVFEKEFFRAEELAKNRYKWWFFWNINLLVLQFIPRFATIAAVVLL